MFLHGTAQTKLEKLFIPLVIQIFIDKGRKDIRKDFEDILL